MVKVRVQRVLADGNCLFRSLATTSLLNFTGFNCGTGTAPGKEKTIGDAFHNITMLWIRRLVAHRFAGHDVNMHTKWGKYSLATMFRLAKKTLEKYGTGRAFSEKRGARRNFIAKISPNAPRLVVGDGSHMLPCGLSAFDVSSSGRGPRESFGSYVKRMSRLKSWGGAAECYIASIVFGNSVQVFQRNMLPEKYSPENVEQLQRPVKVLFNVDDHHYDAILTVQ
jgi:hypothetical protein